MNGNPNMANMNPMGGPVGAPVPMMNNGGVIAAQVPGPRQIPVPTESQRTLLNTYIYEYFLRNQMFDCARSLVNGDHQINVTKDGSNRRRDENGNLLGNGLGDDPMDTDSKDDIDAKLPDDLPAPKLPMPASESSFLYEWFCLFWDIFNAQRTKGGNGPVNQYVSHTQVCIPRCYYSPLLGVFLPIETNAHDSNNRGCARINSRRCSVRCVPMAWLLNSSITRR